MPVLTVLTRAPRNSNDVYRMRRRGRRLNGLGSAFQYNESIWDAPAPQETVIGPSGGAAAHQQYQDATRPSVSERITSGLRSFNTFLTQGAGKDLLQTGVNYYGAREDRQSAQAAADIARREAALAEQRAAVEIEEARAREQMLRQASGRSGQQTDWVMPLAIAGGAGLLLLMIMKRK